MGRETTPLKWRLLRLDNMNFAIFELKIKYLKFCDMPDTHDRQTLKECKNRHKKLLPPSANGKHLIWSDVINSLSVYIYFVAHFDWDNRTIPDTSGRGIVL